MKNISVAIFLLLGVCCHAQVRFGTLVNFPDSDHTTSDITDVADQLGVKYVRQSVIMQGWDGTSTRFDQFTSSGFKVLLNVNYGVPSVAPIPFPKDTTAYKNQLSQILDIHHAEVIVIENEEITEQYHSGSIEDYINELTAAIGVCHSKGLKVANAGLLTPPICILVYNDYLARGLIAEAADFKARTFNSYMSYYIDHPEGDSDLGVKVEKCNTLIAAFKNLALDYVNFHLAEPVNGIGFNNGTEATPKVYQEITSYLTRVTGKPVMTNETAQKNLSPDLVTSMLNEYKKTTVKYVIWYSGDDEGVGYPDSALHNSDLTLRLNGIAFSNFMGKKTQDLSDPGLYSSTIPKFETLCLGSGSAPQIFTIIGSGLDGSNINIGPVNGYSFSRTSVGGFTKTLAISGYGSSFTIPIYIHLNSFAEGNFNDSILISGGGVQPVKVAVNGSIVNTSPDFTPDIKNISCYNDDDGAITLTPQGGTGPFTYNWTNAGTFKSTDQDIANLSPGFYTVEVTSSGGCTKKSTYRITQPAKLNASILRDSNIICKNGSTTVRVSAKGGTLPYTGVGTFNANAGKQYFTVTDTNGCNSTTSIFLPNGTKVAPLQSSLITGNDADNKGICGNGNYTYSIKSVRNADFYTWGVPDGVSVASSTGITATINADSTFVSGYLTVAAGNSCGTGPASSKIINKKPATPDSISGPKFVTKNQKNIVYTVYPAVDGISYSWSVNSDAKIISGQNTSSITVNWSGRAGTIRVNAVNDCMSSYQLLLNVAITPMANDSSGQVVAVTTSQAGLQVMPNPAKETAHILFNAGNAGKYILEINDFAGKLLEHKEIAAFKGQNKIDVDIHNYSNGAYIITLFATDGERKKVKLIKE